MTTQRSWWLLGALAAGLLLLGPDGRAQDVKDSEAPPADPAAAEDDEWPRVITATTATIVVYQPQLDSFGDGTVEAHAALAITAAGATEPVYGAVWFKAKTEIDREARVCNFYDVEVPAARFPDSTPESEAKRAGLIREVVPGWVHPVSLDRLLPALEALEKSRANDDRLRNDAPRIVVEKVPALLVPIDGEAKLVAVTNSRIQRVVNTPVALLYEPTAKTWWIDAGASWIYASSVDGPYHAAAAVPAEIAAVRTSNERRADAASRSDGRTGAVPKIVVAHEPAELIVFDGEPAWSPVVGEELSYATNSATAVLRRLPEDRFYALLSGRWFRTPSLETGPWEFVESEDLPGSFREIPEDSEIGGVLAHVAGTDLANEAILDAQMPQTKAIRRAGTTCTVVYDGEPSFAPIPGTDLRYAVNTQSQVLLCEQRYYCCDQGVWFVAPSPTGPWTVAGEVPRSFREIPPENPCYNVKYVYVYDTTPEVVYVGYTPGYLGWYCWRGGVVWGTGWSYPCWAGASWYPRCSTWGVSVGYNPWSGGWYEGLAFHCGGGWSIGIGYCSDGWYWGGGYWGGGWWGPCGYRNWHHDDDECHRPCVYSHDFDHPGSHGSGHGDAYGHDRGGAPSARRHASEIYDNPRNQVRNAPGRFAGRPAARTPAATSAQRPARPRNDVFADGDARLYRRDADGAWRQRAGGDWKPVRPAPERPASAPTPRTAPPSRPHAERPPVDRPQVRSAPTPRLGRDAWARDRANTRERGGGGSGRPPGGGRKR